MIAALPLMAQGKTGDMIIIRKNGPSAGAVALKNALVAAGHTCVFSQKNAYTKKHLIINWGNVPDVQANKSTVINRPDGLAVARNKLETFRALEAANVSIPEYWTSKALASEERGRDIVLERHTLTGEAGEGIVVKRREDELDDAPMYVRYIKKSAEYRVHIVAGEAVFVQQKRRDSEAEQTPDEKLIRNHANGWVFCISEIDEDIKEALCDVAEAAAVACDVQLCAVDLIVGRDDGNIYVLELNGKPGLTSPTLLEAYVERLGAVAAG